MIPIAISVIVPVYGVEDYISQFADSAFSQTYQNIEYIFVNDGTKDNSIEILRSIISEKYSHWTDRVKIIEKENAGLPSARRDGLLHATGDYVWHVDPDDWLEPDAVESIVNSIKETGSDLITFGFYKEYNHRSTVKIGRHYRPNAQKEYLWDIFNHNSYSCVWNKCVKRSLYLDDRLVFPKYSYAEDTFLTTQLVGLSSCLAFLDKPLYHYRKTNPNAITRQNLGRRHKEYVLNMVNLYEHYRALPSEVSLLSPIRDALLIKIGWYSMIHGVDILHSHQYLAADIRNAKVNIKADVFILAQFCVKLLARFK